MFTFALIPDRQIATERWNDLNTSIVDDILKRGIEWSFAVGDLTEWPRIPDWRRIRDALRPIAQKLTTCAGNHDRDKWDVWASTGNTSDRSLNNYNAHFPAQQMAGYLESLPGLRSDNVVQAIRAGGTDWISISLNHDPTLVELTWLDQMLTKYASKPVIITTHEYLNGNTMTPVGQNIWTAIRKHGNVFMTLSGHMYPASGYLKQVTDMGTTVVSIMADYQSYDAKDPNGYYGILECDPDVGTIKRTTFSPALGTYMSGAQHAHTITGVTFPSRNQVPPPSIPTPTLGGTAMRRYSGVQTGPVGEKISAFVDKYHPNAN